MKNSKKPTIAFFDFTCCEGCQLTVVDTLQTNPELLDVVKIVEFREAMSEKSDRYDVAFIEGSCTRAGDEDRLHDIRKRAGIVIALGACAHLGGVNAIRNRQKLGEVREYVYGDHKDWFDTYEPRAIQKVIAVDGVIPGCPIDSQEFLRVVKGLLQGRLPKPPDYPVCMECKLNETICLYQREQVCLGPVIRAGCRAVCPTYGASCIGCRGLIPGANIPAMREVLLEHGVDEAEIDSRLTLFLTNELYELAQEKAHV
ncbi:NADH:ubiquinone oxidoreductase [Candidatus Leptofilum sp.]|uniref:NADH-quinone oxidoreductase subunit B family protein n=1 Tax=Candidatus Leptofilum sp. TaxID=3241576 RepID=UPI003B5A62E1